MAAGADRQVAIDLLARDKSEKATKSFAKNMDNAADATDRASFSAKELGSSSDRATKRIEGMDRQIKTVKQNLVFLHQAMGDAANDAERFDISKGIRKAEAEIKRLSKSRDVLKDLLPAPDPAKFLARLGSGLASGASGLSTKVGGSVGPSIGIGIAAAAAPVLLGTLSTALAGGAAAGVIGAGLALAVKGDPKLLAAGKQAGSTFIHGLEVQANRALGTRIPGILANLSDAGDRMSAKLGIAFSKLGPYIKPFVKDVTAAGEAIVGSLIDKAGDSGPALMAMGKSIRIIGDGFAEAVGVIADGGPEMAQNIVLISGAIADLMKVTAASIRTTALLGDVLGGVPLALLKRHYNEVAKEQKEVADGAPDAAAGIKDMGQVAAEAAPPLQTAADALKDIVAANKSLFDSTTSVAAALDKANVSFAENGKTLNKNTAAGRENRDALSSLADAMNRKYEASLKVNGEGPKTDAIAQSNARNFITLATRLSGSRKQAIELANKLLAIPDVTRKVTIQGLSQAKIVARRISETLNAIKDKNVRINYITPSGQSSSALRAAYNKNAGREYGGPVTKGHAYVVGEKRPEVFVPDRDGKIVPSIESYARAGGSGGSGVRSASGSAPRQVAVTVHGGGVNDMLYEMVNYGIRTGAIVVSVS